MTYIWYIFLIKTSVPNWIPPDLLLVLLVWVCGLSYRTSDYFLICDSCKTSVCCRVVWRGMALHGEQWDEGICSSSCSEDLWMPPPPSPTSSFINTRDAYITPLQIPQFSCAIYKPSSMLGKKERGQFMPCPSRTNTWPLGGCRAPDFRELLLESRHGRARQSDRWGGGR